MVKVILGGAGTGKTKTMIDLINTAAKEAKGNVVCIAKGSDLRFDISHSVRLIDVEDYAVHGYEELMGFVAGMHAGNYDICEFYIDSLLKVAGDKDLKRCDAFIKELDAFAAKHEVSFTVAMSGSEDELTEDMKKYL